MGLKDDRRYNVRNLAAYENPAIGLTDRDETWLWPGDGHTGAELKNNGFLVSLAKVPISGSSDASPGDWAVVPFEPQFMKVLDVTPPGSPVAEGGAYQVGETLTFNWSPLTDLDDNIATYLVEVLDEEGTVVGSGNVTDGSNRISFTGIPGGYRLRVTAVSAAQVAGEPFISAATELLDPDGDADGDGQTNAAEAIARTDALDPASVFRILSVGVGELSFSSVPGVTYQLQRNDSLDSEWEDEGPEVKAAGPSTTVDAADSIESVFFRVNVVR